MHLHDAIRCQVTGLHAQEQENSARLYMREFPNALQLREHRAADGDNIWLLTTS
jgi:hypothetical protein